LNLFNCQILERGIWKWQARQRRRS